MSADTPVACSLSADELPERIAEISAIGRDALLALSPGNQLRFRADRATRERLDAIIATESQCCPFLSLELREDAGHLVLSVAAPEGAEPLASDLVNAFAADAQVL